VDPCLKNPLVPPALGALTLKALAKPPDERFQTGKAFARALEEACPGLADDDEVAGFMGELFGEQLRASRALFEAAAHDANTAELHGLASLLSPQGLAPVEAVTQSHTDRPATAGLMTPLMRPKVSPRPPAVELSKAMTEPLEHVTEMARPPVPRRTGVVALVVAASLAAVLGVVVFALKAPPPAEPPNLPAVPFQRPAAEVALARGERALAAKDAAGAAQAFAEVLGKDPTNWTALFGAGVAARQLRDDAQARKRLEEAVNRAPEPKDAARALFELACVQARSGDAAGALAGLQRAIGLVGVAPFAERLQSEPDLAALRGTAGFKRLRLRPSAGVE
jgi:tetratricopeptide (TPR) repeat protein